MAIDTTLKETNERTKFNTRDKDYCQNSNVLFPMSCLYTVKLPSESEVSSFIMCGIVAQIKVKKKAESIPTSRYCFCGHSANNDCFDSFASQHYTCHWLHNQWHSEWHKLEAKWLDDMTKKFMSSHIVEIISRTQQISFADRQASLYLSTRQAQKLFPSQSVNGQFLRLAKTSITLLNLAVRGLRLLHLSLRGVTNLRTTIVLSSGIFVQYNRRT